MSCSWLLIGRSANIQVKDTMVSIHEPYLVRPIHSYYLHPDVVVSGSLAEGVRDDQGPAREEGGNIEDHLDSYLQETSEPFPQRWAASTPQGDGSKGYQNEIIKMAIV